MHIEPCPFCGELGEIRVDEYMTLPVMNRPPNVISCDITHWCKPNGLPRLSIKVTGRDKQESIAAWNRRTDFATYNPETHLLIAKDEVPRGLSSLDWKRDFRLIKLAHDTESVEWKRLDRLEKLFTAAFIAAKMGG